VLLSIIILTLGDKQTKKFSSFDEKEGQEESPSSTERTTNRDTTHESVPMDGGWEEAGGLFPRQTRNRRQSDEASGVQLVQDGRGEGMHLEGVRQGRADKCPPTYRVPHLHLSLP